MEDSFPNNINYADVIKRRLPLGMLTTALLAATVVGIALALPSFYKSKAIILIEQQDIPLDLVRSLVTSYADQRIQVISQRVLTNANLAKIIEQYDLYSEDRENDPLERVIESMREDIGIEPISADVVDQKSGKATKATIAFELSYESKSPRLAQRVANDLLSLFLNENLKQRTEATEETLSFLTDEAESLRETVSDLESRLAEFKEQNSGRLPELTPLNLQLMNSREQDLVQVQNQIRALEQQRVYLQSEISQHPANSNLFSETGRRIMGPADRLKVLEADYIPLSARYGANHPDVVSMRKEIESLRASIPGRRDGSEIAAKLKESRTQMAELQNRYGEEHPDMQRLRKEIESLEREVASQGQGQAQTMPVLNQKPDNPIYIQLHAQIQANRTELDSLYARKRSLEEKISEFETKLTETPGVEREYRALSRDYENSLAKYREVLAKQQEAEIAKNLESEQKGERFTLIEPPIIPEEPDSPNRAAISLVGFLLAIGGGVGTSVLAESVDDRVFGRAGVSRVLGVPPLAVIPFIENKRSRWARRRINLIVIAAVAVFLLFLALLVHLFFSPLDVVYFRAARLLGF